VKEENSLTEMNRQIVLAARPEGLPKPSDFRIVETPVPELTEGQFLAKTSYFLFVLD
jgi:NADPH-dependent curcumin reductase